MDVKLLIFVTLLCRLNTPTLTTGLADSNTDDVCTVSKLKTCKLSGDQLHRVPGPIGDKGATGAPGNPGLDGPKGETIQGLQGLPGQKGDKGLPGLNGSDGIKGDTGKPGLKGEPGDSNLGPKGPPGTQGEAGPPGPTGPNGAPGLSGLPALCHCTIEQKPEEEVSEGMSIPSSKPKKSDHISDVKMTSEKCVTGLGKSKSIKYTGKAPSTTDEIATKEYKYKSEQFWLSEEGVSLNDLYNLTQVQLKQYRHIATNAKQTIRYHCRNSSPYSANNTSSSIKLLMSNDVVVGPTPSDMTPLSYKLDTHKCMDGDNDDKYSDIVIKSTVERFPVRDILIRDIRDKLQEIIIEHVELCFS